MKRVKNSTLNTLFQVQWINRSRYHQNIPRSKLALFVIVLCVLAYLLAACNAASAEIETISPNSSQIVSPTITQFALPSPKSADSSGTPSPFPSLDLSAQIEDLPPDQLPPEPTEIEILNTPFATLSPGAWKSLPVIPEVSEKARQIYQLGLEMGNDPHSFSKVGDCQSITTYFLASFDLPGFFSLGDYSTLQETIDWFGGSFKRESLSVKGGFNAAAILSPLRADPKFCENGEGPIACEYRLHHPSLALISLEEWWSGEPQKYEKYMRQIIEFSIQQGVLPILATKADNLEGDHQINETIARLANEYGLPMWNFWAAVQSLPHQGLILRDAAGTPDLFHLTHSQNFFNFDDRLATQSGWAVRNLTALQALDAVWREVSGHADLNTNR